MGFRLSPFLVVINNDCQIAVCQHYRQRAGLAPVLVFYNVQPGTAAQLKN